MAESIYPRVDTAISLKDFVNFVDNSPIIPALQRSEYKAEYFTEVADKFAQLALNRHFLTDRLIEELRHPESFQVGNNFKPSTIVLHEGDGYVVRALVWIPPSTIYPPDVFFYFAPHDHNFDFFTVGYFGPGYTTKLFTYDIEKVQGVLGEIIDLRFIEETNLVPNKVMYYYANRDAHIQYPSKSLSISLNLILLKTHPAHKRQYEFELLEEKDKAKLISGNLDTLIKRKTLIETAANLGDESSLALIRQIALNNSNEQLRAIAWRTLLSRGIHCTENDTIALQKQPEYVRAYLATD